MLLEFLAVVTRGPGSETSGGDPLVSLLAWSEALSWNSFAIPQRGSYSIYRYLEGKDVGRCFLEQISVVEEDSSNPG